MNAGIVNLLLLCTSQWGRLDSYLDMEDLKDIMDGMKDRYDVRFIYYITLLKVHS